MFKHFLITALLTLIGFAATAQLKDYSFGDGLRYTAKDSTFGIKASFRFQTLFIGNWQIKNNDFSKIGDFSSNFLIRRSRLKFNGFAYSPKLTYKLELALSNRDINHKGSPYYGEGGNIILDAYLKWNFYKAFSLKVGQFKLPGNRERLVSSASLQFVDRSLLNSKFNLDRDIGASLHYDKTLGEQFGLHLTAVFAQGEGRNIIAGNLGGYQSSFKVEIMPFGSFSKKGAYVGGDIQREDTPKLAFALAIDKNHGTARTNGNLGQFLPSNAVYKDLITGFADFMFKYKGISVMGEYVIRNTHDNDAFVLDEEGNYITTYNVGSALNLQAGYLFKNNFELAARYTYLSAQNNLYTPNIQHYTLGLSKYLKGHNLKVQTDLGYMDNPITDDGLIWRMQVEFEI